MAAVGDVSFPQDRWKMPQKLYKCFRCGKLYQDEQSAVKCHGAPVQHILKQERKKPRFLGN